MVAKARGAWKNTNQDCMLGGSVISHNNSLPSLQSIQDVWQSKGSVAASYQVVFACPEITNEAFKITYPCVC